MTGALAYPSPEGRRFPRTDDQTVSGDAAPPPPPYYLRSITTVSFPNPRFHEKISTSDRENFYANQTRARRAAAGRARLCQRAQALPERRADANGFRRVRL